MGEHLRVHDPRVLALEVLALEAHAPDVGRVREELPERVLGPRAARALAPLARGPGLRLPAARVERLDGARHGLVLGVEREDLPHPLRLGLVHDDPPALGRHVVAERRRAARPPPAPACGVDLVARALGDRLAFELGEACQQVQRQAPDRRRGVELLRDGGERDAVLVELRHEVDEVGDRARRAGRSCRRRRSPRGPPRRPPRVASAPGARPWRPRARRRRSGRAAPASPARAGSGRTPRRPRAGRRGEENSSFASRDGLARVEGAADLGGPLRLHLPVRGGLRDHAPPFFRWKNALPFQCEPVTAFATALSERYGCPSYS